MFKIAVLISGGGSNLQAIMDSIDDGFIDCSIEMVISDRKDAAGIDRAKARGIKTYILERKVYGERLSKEIYHLTKDKVDIIVLAGFLSILDKQIINSFKNKIINIHPSLIPAFCGLGMYGKRVHEKVIEYGVKYSGCTVHFVDEDADSGPIILQSAVPVYPEDTVDILQKRVLQEEHWALPHVIKLLSKNCIRVEGRKVFIESRD